MLKYRRNIQIIHRLCTAQFHSKHVCHPVSVTCDKFPLDRMKGKVGLAINCADGFGLCMVKRLNSEGAKVLVHGTDIQELSDCMKELQRFNINTAGFTCDLNYKRDREKMFEKIVDYYGGMNFMLVNVPVGEPPCSMPFGEEHYFDEAVMFYVKEAVNTARDSIPYLLGFDDANVLFVPHFTFTDMDPLKVADRYVLVRCSLAVYAKQLASDYKDYGIRFNVYAPGIIQKEDNCIRPPIDFDIERITVIRPRDARNRIATLLSSESKHVNGLLLVEELPEEKPVEIPKVRNS